MRLRISDFAIICAAVLIAFATRFWWGESAQKLGRIALDYWLITVIIVVSWVVLLGANHTRDARVVGIGVTEYRRVVNASFVAFGLLAIAFLILKIDVARGYFILALPIGLIGLVVNRWSWRRWLARQRKQGNYVSHALVVGERADVDYVIRQIDKISVSVYQVVGAAIDTSLDDDTDRDDIRTGAHAELSSRSISVNGREIPILAGLGDVARAAALNRVDAVIVAGQPRGGGNYIRDLGWDLEGVSAELVVASRLTNVAGPRIHFRPVEGLPLMHVELPQYEGGKHVLKRALDIVASGVALVVLAPLMAMIALVVRRDSEGPVLFRQERVGRGGKPFAMIKFRSMVQNAEDDLASLTDQNEGSGLLFKMKDDPRITRVGHILRKYSLDELPQLWNILIGQMSLVGPRPPLQSEVAAYGDRVHRRLYIKPGLTGMWQVNGRSHLDWDESVRLDLYYVENWSLAGDLVILWRTFRVVVNPVGAY